ncbi:MaoC family dehydratase [Kyrpidia tusciae]|uniref:MaoC domain protein dehydratase n=1 Tax=Kyrpidia tusciae (strain DSM 2912 / NBRC 15312 / T2) TaxID=562970 RepID=D5WXT2_KYRT2|nr:MaoC/PaaZ C-terminal domain-containing protein [Kyrpidia tusciae]ADG05991.1 MaoC domain protein dehydratase [Kyrpidia tusciae DSM 2912]
MGLYFEDFNEGMEVVSPGRTVTEADITNFAGLSGDYNEIHTNEEFAAQTRFGRRLAHGLLGLSMLTGLMQRTGIMEGTVIALLGINNWRFVKPVFIGDTIHARMIVTGKRETSNPAQGIVFRKFELINQRGEIVQEGEMPVMVRRKGSARAAKEDV